VESKDAVGILPADVSTIRIRQDQIQKAGGWSCGTAILVWGQWAACPLIVTILSSESNKARSDPEPWRDGCVFRNHDNSVADVIIFRVEIFRFPLRRNYNSVGNACVFVNDSAIHYAIAADADGNFLRTAIATEFVKISAHHHAVANGCAALNDAA